MIVREKKTSEVERVGELLFCNYCKLYLYIYDMKHNYTQILWEQGSHQPANPNQQIKCL